MNQNNNIAKESPEFIKIINLFNHRIALLRETSTVIYDKLNEIGDIRVVKKEEEKGEILQDESIISQMYCIINNLSDINSKLDDSKNGLIKFLG